MTINATQAEAPAVAESKGFRPDVQGLRAIAVGAVLLYHAGLPFLPGGFVGVDVFFVISGFLITGSLIREAKRTGQIRLTEFYARRVRRIIPAATLVLIATAIATALVLPRTRWDRIGEEIVGSALYYVNWLFAANTNYLNADVAPSPLQHFWTLAVEEQFYIVWPLVLCVGLYLARPKSSRGRGRSRHRTDPDKIARSIVVGVLLITVPSLAWSIYATMTQPAPSYFTTTTRLWELGIGALVAVFASQLRRIPGVAAVVIGWLGLIAIVASATLFSAATPFPGFAALLPTLGAAGVIIGGMCGRETAGVGVLLVRRPMLWVGAISYSLYLWHWPMIVVGTFVFGGKLELWQGLALVTLAIVPAWLSYKFIESPFRTWEFLVESTERTLQIGIAMMTISAMSCLLFLLAPASSQATAPRAPLPAESVTPGAPQPARGAELLMQDPSVGVPQDSIGPYTPSPMDAAADNPSNFTAGCHQEENETDFEPCVLGDADSDFVVALVGDSHAAQWTPAVANVAEKSGWRLEAYTKSSCPLTSAALQIRGERFYSECAEWNAKAEAALTGANKPDLVLVSSSQYVVAKDAGPGFESRTIAEGYSSIWGELKSAGVPVGVILDNPQPRFDVPECASINVDALTKCAFDRAEGLKTSGYGDLSAAAQESGASALDFTDLICPTSQCAPVVGSVLVYRDTNHITATYIKSLTRGLAVTLKDAGFPAVVE